MEVSRDADAKYVISHTQMIFREVGVNQLYVQLDYEFHSDAYQNLREFPSFNHQDQPQMISKIYKPFPSNRTQVKRT